MAYNGFLRIGGGVSRPSNHCIGEALLKGIRSNFSAAILKLSFGLWSSGHTSKVCELILKNLKRIEELGTKFKGGISERVGLLSDYFWKEWNDCIGRIYYQ